MLYQVELLPPQMMIIAIAAGVRLSQLPAAAEQAAEKLRPGRFWEGHDFSRAVRSDNGFRLYRLRKYSVCMKRYGCFHRAI